MSLVGEFEWPGKQSGMSREGTPELPSSGPGAHPCDSHEPAASCPACRLHGDGHLHARTAEAAGLIVHPRSRYFVLWAHVAVQTQCSLSWRRRRLGLPAEAGPCYFLHEDRQERAPSWQRSGTAAHLVTTSPSPGLSVPNVHGALAPLAIPSAAAAAAAAGRITIPGLGGAGNSVLLVSNLNPEVRGSWAVHPGGVRGLMLSGLSASVPQRCRPSLAAPLCFCVLLPHRELCPFKSIQSSRKHL